MEYILNTSTRLFNSGNASFLATTQLRVLKFRLKSIKDPQICDSVYRARCSSQFLRNLNRCYRNTCSRASSNNIGTTYLFTEIPVEISISWTLNNGSTNDRCVVTIDPILQNSTISNIIIQEMTVTIMKLSTVFIKKSISSNRIEGKFGNFDLSVPISGRKNFISYQNMVDVWLTSENEFENFSNSSIYAIRNLNKAIQIEIMN